MIYFLEKKLNFRLNVTKYPGAILAILISIGYILATYGPHFIIGDSSFWMSEVDDVTQYISGFNMYLSSPWNFPLLAFDSLNYPQGTRVTFVDAIPIYSFVLKLLLPENIAPFNPFGYWIALCLLLQGISAWWITKELNVNSWLFFILLLLTFLTYPALLARIGHISLMSHWVLLFSLALYIRGRRQKKLSIGIWTILLVSIFYINIYLFVMASGIYFAAIFSNKQKFSIGLILKCLIPFLTLTASLFIFLLPLPSDGIARDTGFGFYSMNLLSPFTGGRFIQLQATIMPGQYEGFNYLGLGVIIAFFASLFLIKDNNNHCLRNNWQLMILLLGYFVYSLSDNVYFGSQLVMIIDYPAILDSITSQFRVSGRFFWPVGYCIVIFSFLMLYKYFKNRTIIYIAIMISITMLQIMDVKNHYKKLKDTLSRESISKINYSAWDGVIGNDVKTLYIYPKFKCGGDPNNTILPVMKYAAYRNLNLNTGYISRHNPTCDNLESEIKQSSRTNSAYIFVKGESQKMDVLNKIFPAEKPPVCNEVDFAYICR
ncbi:DUF6311 domain-containing protein [Yersinia sp. 1652 StPb PI]|uniref:DUF6311 domain-containing protein n=1 Tax=Yersinia sp. 1652 StPb PI TaxID=3061649 RepID=UPI00355C1770